MAGSPGGCGNGVVNGAVDVVSTWLEPSRAVAQPVAVLVGARLASPSGSI